MPVPATFFEKFIPKAGQSWTFIKILHRYIAVLSESLLINTHPTVLASERQQNRWAALGMLGNREKVGNKIH